MSCTAKGRPSPQLSLISPNGEILNQTIGGTLLQSQPQESKITGEFLAACNHTGTFQCKTDSPYYGSSTKNALVFVACK